MLTSITHQPGELMPHSQSIRGLSLPSSVLNAPHFTAGKRRVRKRAIVARDNIISLLVERVMYFSAVRACDRRATKRFLLSKKANQSIRGGLAHAEHGREFQISSTVDRGRSRAHIVRDQAKIPDSRVSEASSGAGPGEPAGCSGRLFCDEP